MGSMRDMALRAGAILLTAGAVYLGTGLEPLWWMTWLAPVPALAAARRSGRAWAFSIGFAGWLLGSLNMWSYLSDDIGLPLAVVVPFLTLPAALFGGAALLFRALIARGRAAVAVVAAAAFWTTAEYLVAFASPHGTFGSLAYTQSDCLPVLQLASITGVWGIGFLIMFTGAAAAALLPPRRAEWRLLTAAALVVALPAGLGVWRVNDAPDATRRVAVGLAAADAPGAPPPLEDAAGREILDAYARAVDGLSAQGASMAVLPETIVSVPGHALGDLERALRVGRADRPLLVVAGLATQDADGHERNAALAIRRDGRESAAYYKRHLIPGLEDRYRPGNTVALIDDAGAPAGIAICKDLDFPSLGRRYGERDIALMLVPAWDFGRDGWLHSRMAVMRGVENGFAMARSARRGLLTASDARGRVLAEASSTTRPMATLTAIVPLEHLETLYTRFGDWFAGLSAVLLIAALSRLRADQSTGGSESTCSSSR